MLSGVVPCGVRRVALLVFVFVLAAFAGSSGEDQSQLAERASRDEAVGRSSSPSFGSPPPVVVESAERKLELEASTFCWGSGCALGPPPQDLQDIGPADEVTVRFEEGWEFGATFQPFGQECGRDYPATLTPREPTVHQLVPRGPAGDYEVTLFGRGGASAEHGGDLFVSFRWRTNVDGPMPDPTAQTSILADHDGSVDSYGVGLSASHLAVTPKSAHATVVVTSADGASLPIELTGGPSGCDEGAVMLQAPLEQGLAAVALGDSPFPRSPIPESTSLDRTEPDDLPLSTFAGP